MGLPALNSNFLLGIYDGKEEFENPPFFRTESFFIMALAFATLIFKEFTLEQRLVFRHRKRSLEAKKCKGNL